MVIKRSFKEFVHFLGRNLQHYQEREWVITIRLRVS